MQTFRYLLSDTGIIVHQYDRKFGRAAAKELDYSLLGWELEFPASAMKEFVCEQRTVPAWKETAPEGAKRTISKFSSISCVLFLALLYANRV